MEEEANLLRLSKKKFPKKEGDFSGEGSLIPKEEEWMGEENVPRKTYAQLLSQGDSMEEEGFQGNKRDQKEDSDNDYIVEFGSKGHPNIIISKEEKERLARPWKKTLIVKLLGKKLGYTVLRKKIEAAWVRCGSIILIDVGNEFYFVKFHSEEDY